MYPPEYVDEIALTEMSLTAGPGRTHMFYTGEPEFAFGSGLSYTRWELAWDDGAWFRLEEQARAAAVQATGSPLHSSAAAAVYICCGAERDGDPELLQRFKRVLEELQTRTEPTPSSTAPRGQTKRRSWG